MLRLENISKVYETVEIRTTAVCNTSLEVADGEFVAITGVSGSGKSTLLSLLGLLDTPTAGTIWLDEKNVTSLPRSRLNQLRARTFGYVFQGFHLIEDLSVLENVELVLKYIGIPRARRRDQAVEAISEVGLESRQNHFPFQLSGGQKQRAGIARAIVSKPRAILADEPTGNLDSNNSARIMNLLADLNDRGVAIVMVTHSDKDASFATRQLRMLDGVVEEQ